MRKINFNEVEAAAEGSSYQQLPAGAYVCSITSMDDFADREYVRMTVDIIQGEHANYFGQVLRGQALVALNRAQLYGQGARHTQGPLAGHRGVQPRV